MNREINLDKNKQNEKDWNAFFAKREAFLKYYMTEEQKESWKHGTIEEAERALELRKDLQNFYDNSAYSLEFGNELRHYLKREFENLEYELNNNGCCNLLWKMDDEINKHDNYQLKRIAKKIRTGYYGEWCKEEEEY